MLITIDTTQALTSLETNLLHRLLDKDVAYDKGGVLREPDTLVASSPEEIATPVAPKAKGKKAATPLSPETPSAASASAESAPDPATPPSADSPEEDDQGDTLADAVALATKLVAAGKTPAVKKALTASGAKRVSELKPAAVADFIAALS